MVNVIYVVGIIISYGFLLLIYLVTYFVILSMDGQHPSACSSVITNLNLFCLTSFDAFNSVYGFIIFKH